MTERKLIKALALGRDSLFHVKKVGLIVPNVSYGFLEWEADALIMSKTGFLTEVEVKVSLGDMSMDGMKSKWTNKRAVKQLNDMIKYFYYAVPKDMADEALKIIETSDVEAIKKAGLITLELTPNSRWIIRVVQSPTANTKAKKLTLEQQYKLARLGTMRVWRDYEKETNDNT